MSDPQTTARQEQRRERDQDDQRFHRDADERRAPDDPGDLPKAGWLGVLKRTGKEFGNDKLTHWAAALTYYGVLSIFPALLALVSILGLIGPSATQPLLDNLSSAAPGPAKDILTNALEGLQSGGGKSGIAFVIGLASAIWAASGYISGFMDASNAIWDVEEGRPIYKKLPIRVGITVVMLVLLSALAIMTVVTGPVAQEVGDLIGAGDAAVTAWNIAKWPVMLVVVSFMFAFLYWAAPNVKQPGFKWVSPGGLVAVVLWIVASALFAFYVANFSSYNATYGSLGGVIAFLVWLWISNIAILVGAEFNAELERGRMIEAGMKPADQEPFLEPRDEPKKKEL
ncbi:MAG TPA: YihY/virulence factor BrkB family protein [Solirubrobacteraceae bacterium]|nr:YihY/virulence factor BrkB family protein [Solirubrobacteraceae bacterium]